MAFKVRDWRTVIAVTIEAAMILTAVIAVVIATSH